jgi:hypothetical protein
VNPGRCARCKKEVPPDEGVESGEGGARVHVECDRMASPRAAELLGVGVAQFRRLTEDLCLVHDEEAVNPHYRSGPKMKLYARPKILALQTHPAVVSARARKGARAPKDYTGLFVKRFGAPRNALPAACEAMFNLNRYTRHDTCSHANRTEILDLKTKLVEFLYKEERFTDRVEKLTRRLPEKTCFGCDGTGGDWSGEDCDRCGGSGVFAKARNVASYVFRFTVEGQSYTWMQPDRVMTFQPRVEETKADDGGGPRELETSLTIPRAKLAEAKALVRYALVAAGADSEAVDGAISAEGAVLH